MKTTLGLLLIGALSCQAAIVNFDLSPAGTDVAVGLSPANEAPAVTNSSGSGNEISGGIIFDTDTSVLQIAVGYGSAAGFTDLTGAATIMHLHGPAAAGQSAGPLVDLGPYHFPAMDPTKGGVIYGNIAVPASAVSNLLGGFTYLNIHTAANPPGEIRGQLIPVVVPNSPPTLSCPTNTTVECGAALQLTAVVADPEGDALTVVWGLNGVAVQTNTLPAGVPGAAANVTFTGALAVGTNALTITVIDSYTNTTSCSSTITVVDTKPPVILWAKAVPNVLWPPNHKMIDVRLRARVEDSCSTPTWKIVSVRSSEVKNGKGDGNTSRDWQITGDHTVKLRAERSGNNQGRVYYIKIEATDAAGNVSASRTVNVIVPKSQGKSK